MTTQVMATVVNGMLQPDQTLPLADKSRVRLTIDSLGEWSTRAAIQAWEEIKLDLQERPLHFGGQRFTREELHERR
jgi:hypothetical protein